MQQQYDLIVIGGGILGTFHAWHALQKGSRVLLAERDSYPAGATVRNFGQIVPSGMGRQWFRYGLDTLNIYKSIQEKADISLRHNGTVYIASDDDEQTLIHELKAYYDTAGYPAQLLSQAEIIQRYPSIRASYAREAIFFPEEVSVEPDKLVHRLHQYMREQFPNFTLLYNAPVVACDTAPQGALVTLSGNRQYRAAKAVICCGHEGKLLFPEIFRQSGQVVSKLQMMRTVPFPQVQLKGNILTGLTIRRYESFEENCPSYQHIRHPEHYAELKKWAIHVLFKQATDGSIIIGDSHEYAPLHQWEDLGFNISQHINDLILQEAARIVDFDVYRVATAWNGYYAQHNEHHIFEHDVAEHIHIRTGIGGKGMTAGAGYARANIAQLFP